MSSCKKCEAIFNENPDVRDYFYNSCICEILISNGNCNKCLKFRDYCECEIEYKFESDDMKKTFTCPISYNVFVDPVICSDGHTYERKYIEDWFKISDKSPMTGKNVLSKEFYPNYLLKVLLNAYK